MGLMQREVWHRQYPSVCRVQVDGRALQGYTNHQAVEVLRSTGRCVKLRLARYLRGVKYHQLQHAIALSEAGGASPAGTLTPSLDAPSVASLLAAESVHVADVDAASPLAEDQDDAGYGKGLCRCRF